MKTPIRPALPVLVLSAALALLGAPVGAGADEADDDRPDLAVPAPAAALRCPAPSAATGKSGPSETDSFCQADCENGSTISVNCSGSCRAVDQNCPDVRGHVECNGTVTARCPVCDTSCQVSRECPDGTFLFCQGKDCLGGNGLCFVRCDGVYQFCPGHFGEIIC